MMFFVLRKQSGTARDVWELANESPLETHDEAKALAEQQSRGTIIVRELEAPAAPIHDDYLGYCKAVPEPIKREPYLGFLGAYDWAWPEEK